MREAVAEAGALDAKIGLIVGRSDNSMAGKYKAIKQVYIERTVSIMNAVSDESAGFFDWLLIKQQYHTNLKREKPDKESEVGRSENSVAATKPNRMVMTSKFLGLRFIS